MRLLDKSKISFISFFFVFCIMIYAGKATVFARQLGDIRTIGNSFALIVTFVFAIFNKVKFTKNYFLSLLVFSVYAIATTINNGIVNMWWYSQWIIFLTMAFVLCRGFGERMFVVIETVLCWLCAISLVCWTINLCAPSFMEGVVKKLSFSKPYAEDSNVLANMIVYTINSERGRSEFALLIRNAGFAWEPGAFACFCNLGFFCNMLRTNLSIKQNGSLLIFFLALLSSQSTTGYIMFIIMMLTWLLVNRRFYLAFFLIPVLVFLFSMPFVQGKLFDEINGMQYLDESRIEGSVGRLFSLQLSFQEFLRHPILGIGGWSGGTWFAQHGYEISIISGIGTMLYQYGLIITFIFVLSLVKSSKKTALLFGNNAWALIVVIIGMMISYSLWNQPLYLSFWLWNAYSGIPENMKEITNIENNE